MLAYAPRGINVVAHKTLADFETNASTIFLSIVECAHTPRGRTGHVLGICLKTQHVGREVMIGMGDSATIFYAPRQCCLRCRAFYIHDAPVGGSDDIVVAGGALWHQGRCERGV